LKFFLDENFPLRLHHRLQAEGIHSEHLITLGQRGISDAKVVEHLAVEGVVLLTQDRDFEHLPLRGGKVIISRVSQSLPIARRIEIWVGAIRQYVETRPDGTRFEISQSGELERLPE
jgi:predicted nuclease of predicted toxin-antitoxin system